METIVRWTNRLTVFAGILLVYVVFALLAAGVFGLTVFQEHSMEALMAAIPGLIALMAGTVVVNVSLNLTRIANAAEARAGAGRANGGGAQTAARLAHRRRAGLRLPPDPGGPLRRGPRHQAR